MDSEILGALINATATIVASLVGAWFAYNLAKLSNQPSTREEKISEDPKVQFFILWVLANIVPTIIWWILLDYLNSLGLDIPAASFLAGIVSGIIAGFLQWLVLMNSFQISSIWILAVALGWGAGGGIISFFTFDLFVNYILAGLIVGILEWLILRKYFNNAVWWILAVIIDWLISYWVGGYLNWSFDPTSGAIVGLASSLLTGFAFIFVLKRK